MAAARGGEVSFLINKICKIGPQPLFPLRIKNAIKIMRGYPHMSVEDREEALAAWKKAVTRTFDWV